MSYYKVRYKDIAVSYQLNLGDGGHTFGQQFVDVVREKRGHVGHAFEFCAGPGFIGFSLLANGLCDRLTLADINPEAVRAVQDTIRSNHLEDRVKVYLSDCLESIPESEQWDLVVSNPPHFDGTDAHYREAIRLVDPGWNIHKRFYRDIRKHLRPDGAVIFQENGHATNEADFEKMIRDNGLEVVDVWGNRPPPGSPRPRRLAATAIQKLFWPIERALMLPEIERLVKDNDAYRKLSTMSVFVPKHFYFIWSRPSAVRTAHVTASANTSSAVGDV